MTLTQDPPSAHRASGRRGSAHPADRVHRYAQDVLDGRHVTNDLVRLAAQRHLSDIEHGHERGLRFDPDLAGTTLEFFPALLRLDSGAPFELLDWQAFVIGSVEGWQLQDEDGEWIRRFRNGYIETGKGSGKALALDTPIPTPTGWTTMGAIQAGDLVLDDQGHPTRVLAAHDVMHGHDCYAVTFDDGSAIVADAEHLWETEADGVTAIRTTAAIASSLDSAVHRIRRWRIVACEPVPSVPVRCIRVAAESSLFLAGRSMIPTHNTPMLAAFGLRCLTRPDVVAPEVYSAAATRDQSKILWTDASRMVERSKALKARIDVGAFALSVPSRNGTFQYVSREANTLHGHRPYAGLIDEEHAHDGPDVLNAIRAGTKGQRNAIILRITNSGFDRRSVCWADHEYSVRILEGQLADDGWFAFVCGLDMCEEHRKLGRPEDDCETGCDQWTDEAVWPKANPGLGHTITRRYLREQVTEALGKPSSASVVKRLNFCIWTEGSGRWLDAGRFATFGPADPESPGPVPQKVPTWGGLDLASTRDINALTLVSPRTACDQEDHRELPDGGRCYDLRCRLWLPEEAVARRSGREHVPYDVWVKAGWIEVTPGDVTDYQWIRRGILAMRDADVDIRGIGHDRWNATQLVLELAQDGLAMFPVDQGMATLNAASKRLESDIAKGLVHHDGNPVLRWMVGNAVAEEDAYGNIKPSRKRSSEKIDGVAAWVDALTILPGAPEPVDEPFMIIGRRR